MKRWLLRIGFLVVFALSFSRYSTAQHSTLVMNSQCLDTIVFNYGANYSEFYLNFIKKCVTAYDSVDGDLTDSIKITGDVDTNSIGTYEVLYTVGNSADEIKHRKHYLKISDLSPPEIFSVTGKRIITLGKYSVFNPREHIRITDNHADSAMLHSSFEVLYHDVNTNKLGLYSCAYSAMDYFGNTTNPYFLYFDVVYIITWSIDILEKDLISIYPNPSNGHIQIKSISDISNISIYGYYGALLYEKQLQAAGIKDHQLDISHLAKGSYRVVLENEDGVLGSKMIVLL